MQVTVSASATVRPYGVHATLPYNGNVLGSDTV
jgi:hypothetical protein